VSDIRARRLPKRAAEVIAAELDAATPSWLETDSALKHAVENRIASELGLEDGSVYLDYPEKSAMFGLNILLETRAGDVVRLGPGGRSGLIGLPAVSAELYRSARVLRLFTRGGRRTVSPASLSAVARMDAAEIETALASRTPLLGT
jgi:hypothetical protein